LKTFFTFAAPSRFYTLTNRLLPWVWAVSIVFALAGLYLGFLVAPTDATQGDAYRIIFIHVPAAWMSMLLYLVMAGWAVVGWAFNARLASMVARAIAPTGLVGMGCTSDFRADFAVFVYRLHGTDRIDR
jgi:heme exporter protein C